MRRCSRCKWFSCICAAFYSTETNDQSMEGSTTEVPSATVKEVVSKGLLEEDAGVVSKKN